MKKDILTFAILILFILPIVAEGASSAMERSGYILLQVEQNGEAWYVYPDTGSRYYLGRPADAFAVMKKLGLGVKHGLIENTSVFPDRLSGKILLDVELNGEAYYIYPKDKKKYYLGRPDDAFRIMRELGRGIADIGLAGIPIADMNPGADSGIIEKVLQNVPFTSQAPFGDWTDERQEDGCEEASSLMSVKWARGQIFTNDEALKEITGISDFLLDKYGEYRDINTADTVKWIINDYFNFQNVARKTNISLTDIMDELKKGNIVIAPMNGQIMGNPYFTPPGPTHHMIVIKGYDLNKKVFITNDPGTRRGENYEYGFDVIYEAIRDYPTGSHMPTDSVEKNIIVVWK